MTATYTPKLKTTCRGGRWKAVFLVAMSTFSLLMAGLSEAASAETTQYNPDKRIIGTVSSYGFDPIISTAESIVQRIKVKSFDTVKPKDSLFRLYSYLYPKSKPFSLHSQQSGIFISNPKVQEGSKIQKGDILGYVQYKSSYRIQALALSEEIDAVKRGDMTVCADVTSSCAPLSLSETHLSEYPEIRQAEFVLLHEHVNPNNLTFLPNTRLMIKLLPVERPSGIDSQESEAPQNDNK